MNYGGQSNPNPSRAPAWRPTREIRVPPSVPDNKETFQNAGQDEVLIIPTSDDAEHREKKRESRNGKVFPPQEESYKRQSKKSFHNGYLYHESPRNEYSFDDPKEWMKRVRGLPEFQYRPKRRDYNMPGITRSDFDYDYDSIDERKDSAHYKSYYQGGFQYRNFAEGEYHCEDPREWMRRANVLPEFQYWSKRRDYHMPGVTRTEFDFDSAGEINQTGPYNTHRQSRKSSEGAYRYRDHVDGEYVCDDPTYWMRRARVLPEFQYRPKRRDYHMPGVTRSEYDFEYESMEEREDTMPYKTYRQVAPDRGSLRPHTTERKYVRQIPPDRVSLHPHTIERKYGRPVPLSSKQPDKDDYTMPNNYTEAKIKQDRRNSLTNRNRMRAEMERVRDLHDRDIYPEDGHPDDYGTSHYNEEEKVSRRDGRNIYESAQEKYSHMHKY